MFFMMTEKVNPIGRIPIFEKCKNNIKNIDQKNPQNKSENNGGSYNLCIEENRYKLKNFDISSMIKFGSTIKQISN